MNKEKEIQMFGETVESMKSSAVFTNLQDPYELNRYAMCILSDAQQMMTSGDIETARKFINKAKFFIDESNKIILRKNF